MKKRITALLLTLALIVTYFPTIAFAEDVDEQKAETPQVETQVDNQDESAEVVDQNSDDSSVNVEQNNQQENNELEQLDVEKDVSTVNPFGDKADLFDEEYDYEKYFNARKTVFFTGDNEVLKIVDAHKDGNGSFYTEKPKDPTRAGYTFAGWYSLASLTSKSVVEWTDCECSGSTDGKLHAEFTPFMFAKWERNTYILVLHKNDGYSHDTETLTVRYGREFKIANPFDREHAYFEGWSENETAKATVQDVDSITVQTLLDRGFKQLDGEGTDKYIHLFATWGVIEKATVHYDINTLDEFVQVTNMPYSVKVNKDDDYVIPKLTPQATYKLIPIFNPEFLSWNTKRDGSGKSYLPGATISKEEVENGIDLYAMWTNMPYLITYELNGGEFDDSFTILQQVYLSGVGTELFGLPTPIKEGEAFAGWVDENGNPVENISKFEFGNKTLYATWKTKMCNIVFRDDDTIISERTQEYGQETIIPKNPTKKGYVFKGWTPEVEKVVTGDAEYYALWGLEGVDNDILNLDDILTGDNNQLILFGSLALIALGAIIAFALRRRRG